MKHKPFLKDSSLTSRFKRIVRGKLQASSLKGYNLKTKNNQNSQKIDLYGHLTTKDLKMIKKKHSSRLVGGACVCTKTAAGELGRARRWVLDQEVPCLRADKLGGTTGERQTIQPRVLVQENEASRPLAIKTCGGCGGGINSQSPRRVWWMGT